MISALRNMYHHISIILSCRRNLPLARYLLVGAFLTLYSYRQHVVYYPLPPPQKKKKKTLIVVICVWLISLVQQKLYKDLLSIFLLSVSASALELLGQLNKTTLLIGEQIEMSSAEENCNFQHFGKFKKSSNINN